MVGTGNPTRPINTNKTDRDGNNAMVHARTTSIKHRLLQCNGGMYGHFFRSWMLVAASLENSMLFFIFLNSNADFLILKGVIAIFVDEVFCKNGPFIYRKAGLMIFRENA